MTSAVRNYMAPALLGLLIGVLFTPVSIVLHGAGMGLYDAAVPVLDMRGTIVARTNDSIDVRIVGSKNRLCGYVNIQAYTDVGGAIMHAHIDRVDRRESGVTHPRGVMDIGVWRIWPVNGARTVTVYVQHSCDGRAVLTKVAEVAL